MNRRGFEFSFGWLFSIIVGAMIIVLAIYASVNIVKTGRNAQDSLAGNELGIILTPIETSLEAINKPSPIVFPVRTRVYNTCYTVGKFGEQKIGIATQSGLGKKWEDSGIPSTYYNKYIFSRNTIEGKKANVLAKPFYFPYKVADVMYIWSEEDKYCFVSAPSEVEDELADLGLMGVNFTSSLTDCAKNSTKVCFGYSPGCEITVNQMAHKVTKIGVASPLNYPGDNTALMYGAIFSDPGIYECQTKRLMERTAQLAYIYRAKSELLSSKGCGNNLEGDMLEYIDLTSSYNNSMGLSDVERKMEDINAKNKALECKAY